MSQDNRKRKPQTKRRTLRNLNRIVRVRNNKIHHCLQAVAYQLGCPYQLVFDEFLLMMQEGYTFGYNTGDLMVRRLLERYTGDTD